MHMVTARANQTHLTRLAAAWSAATLAVEADPDAPPVSDDEAPPADGTGWEGVIAVESEMTGDGRLIEGGALRWDISADNPAPLRFVSSDVGAHDGAVTVGRILSVERRGGSIWATGDFDTASEAGREAQRMVRERLQDGVSVDLDDVSFEVRIAGDLMESMGVLFEEGEEGAPETDEEGRVVVATIGSDDEVMVTTSARVRAATIVAVPAFASARIALAATPAETPDETPADAPAEDPALVASAAPLTPPDAWFDNPGLSGPTPITITDDGRIYGHLATWNACHIASPAGPGICVEAPRSAQGYAHFHTGAVRTKEGTTRATGRIVTSTKHATDRLGAAAATQHYDDTGKAVADVCAGEDVHGIWVAGALRPSVTEEDVRVLRASPLSGDWRTVGGGLELVAALAVNVPGFPVPRPAGLVASGALSSLVAAGMLPPRRVIRPGRPGALSTSDLRYLKRLADRERETERTALRDRVDATRAAANRRKIAAFAAKRKDN